MIATPRMLRRFCVTPLLLVACSSSSGDATDAEPGDAQSETQSDTSTNDAAAETPTDSTSETASDAGHDAGALDALHFIGRFDTSDPAGPRFEWPASAVVARFTGTALDVKLK